MNAERLYRVVRLAAQDLADVPGAYVQLGTSMDVETLRELARLLDGKTGRTVYAHAGREPYVIESLRGVVVCGVRIEAQGNDEVRPGDEAQRAFRDLGCEYVDLTAEGAR